ncbi:MAG: putative toxin-antitoxin system toxin component, PIN family [Armatimonadota bacterium]|jgi:putative PIN family toxin of toxin-antitoxin system
MRVVIDTNVLISALFWGGAPRRVVDLAASGPFQAVTSPEMLAQLEGVLAEDFDVPQDRLDSILRDVLSYAELVVADPEVEIDIRDPGDVKVIGCALAGRADWIVTGDNDLLDLGSAQGVVITTVGEFLQKRQRWE